MNVLFGAGGGGGEDLGRPLNHILSLQTSPPSRPPALEGKRLSGGRAKGPFVSGGAVIGESKGRCGVANGESR